MSNNQGSDASFKMHKDQLTIRIGGDMRDRFSKLFKKTISKKGIPFDEFEMMMDKLNSIHEYAEKIKRLNE